MESFYGGRQGVSFVIVKQFDSIESMVQCFEQGAVTTNEVNYGEYVIIDTINKNNPDNGKVYRRGLNYQYSENNSLAGAEYIGQIVGPQGDSPEVSIDDFNTIINEPYNGPEKEYNMINGGIVKGAEIVYDNEGKIDENQSVFNDSIKYTWVTIRDEYGTVKGCKIGFVFPSPVLNFTAVSISPYENTNLIERTDSKEHPFFSQWEISVPKGIKGDSINLFKIEKSKAKAGSSYYTNPNCNNSSLVIGKSLEDDIEVNFNFYNENNQNSNPITLTNEEGEETLFYVKKDSCYEDIIIYKKINYDNLEDGEYEYVSLGSYNDITDIQLAEDGTAIIYYSGDQEPKILEQKIKWIKDIKTENDGAIKITYNTQEIKEIGNINYIMETVITKLDNEDEELKNQSNLAENYHLLVFYSDPAYRDSLDSSQKKTWRSKKFLGADGKGLIRTDWCDMGYVRGESGGVHIIGTLTEEKAQELLIPENPPEVIENDHAYAGWSYAVGEGVNKTLYSYDYRNKKWDTLGTIGNSAVEPSAIIQQGLSIDSADLLNTNGIFLQLEQNYTVY